MSGGLDRRSLRGAPRRADRGPGDGADERVARSGLGRVVKGARVLYAYHVQQPRAVNANQGGIPHELGP